MIAKQATHSTKTSAGNLIDDARSLVDDAFLEELEKRLELESPNHLFRRNVLMAVESHLGVPPGGLASVSRKSLGEDKDYWDAMQTHLSGLLTLLPEKSFKEHVQAWLLRIEVIGKAPEAEQQLRTRQLFELRAGLEDLLVKSKAQTKELTNVRISPNDKLGAARMLVSQLAGTFYESTGKHPREHIRGDSEKEHYSGEFFDFANAILGRIGDKQSEPARGKMIISQLRSFRMGQK
jgi:hypothetical protein